MMVIAIWFNRLKWQFTNPVHISQGCWLLRWPHADMLMSWWHLRSKRNCVCYNCNALHQGGSPLITLKPLKKFQVWSISLLHWIFNTEKDIHVFFHEEFASLGLCGCRSDMIHSSLETDPNLSSHFVWNVAELRLVPGNM